MLLLRSVVPSCVLLLAVACSGTEAGDPSGVAGATATSAGNAATPAAGNGPATAGNGNPGAGGAPTATGGTPASGVAGDAPAAGGTPAATAGSGGTVAVAGAAGTSSGDDPAPRPIMVTGTDDFSDQVNGQRMWVTKSKPIQGKLVLLLGGICTGTGAGGFESFVKQNGFHVFAPKTQTCVNSAPDKYKEIIKATPDDKEANRQVADARMELWDGVDRVDWVTVNKGESIAEETVAAIQHGMTADPGGDWGFFLDAAGKLRTSDVWVVGYSWGSQSWAMISSYVRFGRVIVTSGPVAEGFPNGEWITHPSPMGTPGDRKYLLVGLKSAYPSMDKGDSGDMEKFVNVTKGGWTGMVTNVMPSGMGTFTADQHLFAMVGSNGTSPGGHTVFCNDNPMNGWLPLCKHVMGLK